MKRGLFFTIPALFLVASLLEELKDAPGKSLSDAFGNLIGFLLLSVVGLILLGLVLAGIADLFEKPSKDIGRGSTWEDRHRNDPELQRYRDFVKGLEKEEWWRNRNR